MNNKQQTSGGLFDVNRKQQTFNSPSDQLTRDIKNIPEAAQQYAIDVMTGRSIITGIESEIAIQQENIIQELDPTARRIFTYILNKITMLLPHGNTTADTIKKLLPSREITVSVAEMLNITGQKNKNAMKASISRAIYRLSGYYVRLPLTDADRQRGILNSYAPFIEKINLYRGQFGIVFQKEALIYFANTSQKIMHLNYFKINAHSNPTAAGIYDALSDHYRINRYNNPGNANKLSVTALIRKVPALNESYNAELQKDIKNRKTKQLVILPLLRDLDELARLDMISFYLTDNKTSTSKAQQYRIKSGSIPTKQLLKMFIVFDLKEAENYNEPKNHKKPKK